MPAWGGMRRVLAVLCILAVLPLAAASFAAALAPRWALRFAAGPARSDQEIRDLSSRFGRGADLRLDSRRTDEIEWLVLRLLPWDLHLEREPARTLQKTMLLRGLLLTLLASFLFLQNRRRRRGFVALHLLCIALALPSFLEARVIVSDARSWISDLSRDRTVVRRRVLDGLGLDAEMATSLDRSLLPSENSLRTFGGIWFLATGLTWQLLALALTTRRRPIVPGAGSNESVLPQRALLLALVALVPLGCANRPEPAPSGLEAEATRQLERGEFAAALDGFNRAAYERPDNWRVLVGAATCEAWLMKEDRFQALALSAAAAAPWSLESHLALGNMYVRGGERFRRNPASRQYAALGVEYLRRVFAEAPDTPHLFQTLGLGLHLSGDDGGALLFLDEARRRAPEDLSVLETEVYVLRRLERKSDVIEILRGLEARQGLTPALASAWSWAKGAEAPLGKPKSGN